MFWGLIMEPNKWYTQIVEKSFHVSMASLAPGGDTLRDGTPVQVMLCYDDRNYLLCSLSSGSTWQVPLDLNFQEGTKIAFTSKGRGNVHLTGYLIPEEGELDLDEVDEEEDEDEEVPELVAKHTKRRNESPKESKKAKRLKAASKQEESSDEEEEVGEDSMELAEEVEDDSDDEDVEEDSDEEEEEEDDEDEEEEEKSPVTQQQKKRKEKEQQNKSKQEKQKMVNGKDISMQGQKQQGKKGKEQQQQNNVQQQQNNAQQQAPKKRVVEGGVQVDDLKVGNGQLAKAGKFVSVYYVGRLKNGKKFDSTTQGEGFKFRLGKGEVIKGWDVGIVGMKVGGKRRLVIPPPFAYGAKGSPPTIPGNSTLMFEVELKNVH